MGAAWTVVEVGETVVDVDEGDLEVDVEDVDEEVVVEVGPDSNCATAGCAEKPKAASVTTRSAATVTKR